MAYTHSRPITYQLSLVYLLISIACNTQAASLTATSIDSGGSRITSSAVRIDGAIGHIAARTATHSEAYISKSGYAGQLIDLSSIQVSNSSFSINETKSIQLYAVGVYDDQTMGAVNSITWSVLSGPLVSITSEGLATSGAVYENTVAFVRAEKDLASGEAQVTIIDVDPDNYYSYALDGIPDRWQVQYYGIENSKALPTEDADSDSQNNLFEYIAGTNPTNGNSTFSISIEPSLGLTNQMDIAFTPAFTNRDYILEKTTVDLTSGLWSLLTNFNESTNGAVRTVTDQQATNTASFYRVHIDYTP